MSHVFTPWNFGSLEVPNRLIRSATWEGMADPDGFANDRLVAFYSDLAAGGVGLIIIGYAYVRPDGKSTPGQLGIYSDLHIEQLARIADVIHSKGGLAIMQIVHGGGQASPEVAETIGAIAPSSIEYPGHKQAPHEIDRDAIPELVADFADGARRCMEAGFDGVQLHCAHGYLISRFLSPRTNLRSDEYGGSAEARARFGVEVITAVRNMIGPDAPLSIKLNGEDFEEGGLEIDDAIVAAKLFVQAGVDHIEVSGGTPAAGKMGAARQGIQPHETEAYFREHAAKIKQALSIPVGIVGGIRSLDTCEDILQAGDADTVSICRPLICEPDLPKRWLSGDLAPAKCKSDSLCMKRAARGGVECVTFAEKE